MWVDHEPEAISRRWPSESHAPLLAELTGSNRKSALADHAERASVGRAAAPSGVGRRIPRCTLQLFALILGCSVGLSIASQAAPAARRAAGSEGPQPSIDAAERSLDATRGQRPTESLIVKYVSNGPHAVLECAERLTARGEPFARSTADRSESLDRLRARFALGRHRAVFRRATGPDFEAERRSLQARLARARSARRPAARPNRGEDTLPELAHIYRVPLGPGQDPEDAAAALRSDPHVEYAHPDYDLTLDQMPIFDDPFLASFGAWGQPYADLWGLEQIGAPEAWAVSQGDGVIVAVVDTGLDRFHPDIAANVWVNPGEDLDGDGEAEPEDRNGIDDDGNGFVDDLTGFDFADSFDADGDGFFDGPADRSDPEPFDEQGHGTHVAGTIAAVADNGLGIVGVAPQARIMALKGFPAEGPAEDSVLWRAVLYAAENGATVVNNSWSCREPCPSNPLAEDVLAHVEAIGAVVVTSAGNRSEDVVFRSPENTGRVLTVGALGFDERLATFSNRGWGLDVVAPGGGPEVTPGVRVARRNILSLLTSAIDPAEEPFSVGSHYLRLAGTSMASPHVAGAVALLQSMQPDLLPADVRRLVRRSAADLGLAGHDPTYGAGRLDLPGLLRAVPPDLIFEIEAPRSATRHDPADGPLELRASVAGRDFESLEVDVARGLQGREFRPLSSFAPPEQKDRPEARLAPAQDGTIFVASWPLSEVEDGPYVLRFRARLLDGSHVDEYVVVAIERTAPVELADGERTVGLPDIAGRIAAWPMKQSAEATDPFELAIGRLGATEVRSTTPHADPRSGEPVLLEIEGSPGDVSLDGSIVAWRIREGAESHLEWCRLGARAGTPRSPVGLLASKADSLECDGRRVSSARGTFSRPWVGNGWIVWQRDDGANRFIEGCRVASESSPKHAGGPCAPRSLVPRDGEPAIRWSLRSFDGRSLLLQAPGQLAFCALFSDGMDAARDACALAPIRLAPGTPAVNEPLHDGSLLVFAEVTLETRPPIDCLPGELVPECTPDFAVVSRHRACRVEPSSGLCDSIAISPAVRVERTAGVAVSGDRIAWSMADPLSEPSLRFCELETRTGECIEQRLSASLASQESPAIDGDRIVWRGALGQAPSIWGYALPALEGPERAALEAGRPFSIPLQARRGTSRSLRYEIERVGAPEGEIDPVVRSLRVVDRGWPGGRIFLRGTVPSEAVGMHSLRVRAIGESGLFSESIIDLRVESATNDLATNDVVRKSGATPRALLRWLSDLGRVRKPGP